MGKPRPGQFSDDFATEQEVQSGELVYAESSTGNDSYAITLDPAPTALTTGMPISFKADVANTSAATLDVNGLGAKTIKKLHDQDLATGDIEAGQIVTVVYDGTYWQMQSQSAATVDSRVSRIVSLKFMADDTALTTGDGKMYFTIPPYLNGMNLVDADAAIYTASSSGLPTFQINNLDYAGGAQDMLSTRITIDENEYSSYTATTPPVINTSYDNVATGNRLRIDCDVAGTGTKGGEIILVFQLP